MFKSVLQLLTLVFGLSATEVLAVNGTIYGGSVEFPISELELIAALMLLALATLWVVRKVLSLVRS